MEHREIGSEKARRFERGGGACIVGGDEQHQALKAQSRFGGDDGIVPFGSAADLVPARRTRNCGQPFQSTTIVQDVKFAR
jgi:hypothetical protein